MSAGAANTHILDSASFTPSGGSAWNMTDALEAEDSEGGDLTEVSSDGSSFVNGMFIDQIKGEMSLTIADLAQSTNAGAPIGTVGSLTLKYGKRQAGKGKISGAYLTVVYPNSVLKHLRRAGGLTGHGSLVLTLAAYSTDGTNVATKSVGA